MTIIGSAIRMRAGPLAYAVANASAASVNPDDAAGAAVAIPMTVSCATPMAFGSSLPEGTSPGLATLAGDSTDIWGLLSCCLAFHAITRSGKPHSVFEKERASALSPHLARLRPPVVFEAGRHERNTSEIVPVSSLQQATNRKISASADSPLADSISCHRCSAGSAERSR